MSLPAMCNWSHLSVIIYKDWRIEQFLTINEFSFKNRSFSYVNYLKTTNRPL